MPDRDPVILASGSVFRRRMLESAGIELEVRVAAVDEIALRHGYQRERPPPPPPVVALRLAEEKALAVSRAAGPRFVLGADQVLDLVGEILSKPATVAAARAQLQRLRGRAHTLPTAVVLASNGVVVWRHLDEPVITMRAFSDAFLEAYLAAVGPDVTTSVGGYQVEALGAQLLERIEGDYFSVIGLPLLPVLAALRAHGCVGK